VIEEICKRYDNLENINEIALELSQAIFDGADKSIFVPKSKELAENLKKCESKQKYFLDEKKFKDKIDIKKIMDHFKDFKNIISSEDYESQHKAIIAFVKQIVVDPDENKIKVDFFELPSELLVNTNNGAPKL